MHFNKFLTTTVLAAGASGQALTTVFSLLSLRSGTDLQFASIVDNDLTLAIGLPQTLLAPPSNVDGSSFTNTTSFIYGGDSTVYMNAATPGIQYLYVNLTTGLAKITPGHTDYIPDGGSSNFGLTTDSNAVSFLAFNGASAFACGEDPIYHLKFDVVPLDSSCIGIDLLAAGSNSDAAGAWQYV